LSIRNAGEVRKINVGAIRDALKNSSEYFAIGTIPLREWFDPNSLVYLTTIVEHQQNTPGFRHVRVLLFDSESRLDAVKVSYLDWSYADSFAAIHERLGISLLYLGPEHILDILERLDENTVSALGCYRWFARPRLRRICPRKWQLRRGALAVPFAFVRVNSGSRILQFSKRKGKLKLREVTGLTKKRACEAFVNEIRNTVYWPDGTVKEDFKFRQHLSLSGA
jgi:hypothetical protein